MKSSFKIGIIGGNGAMGSSFRNFLDNKGLDYIFSDNETDYSNIDVVKFSDIVILSISLGNYERILKEISPYLKKGKLLVDFGSLKLESVKLMKFFFDGEILATHPLFGPDKNFFGEGNSIVISKTDPSEKTDFIISLFKENKLNIVELSPEEHDEIMAYIHGFYYLMNITYIDILKNKFQNIDKLEAFKTTSFKSYLNSLNNIFNGKDELIKFISYSNPYIDKVKNEFINKLGKDINIGDLRNFFKRG